MSTFPATEPYSRALVFTGETPHGYESASSKAAAGGDIPAYLHAHYWWAYIHPLGVRLFERQWLVNVILWGNYARLCDAALAELGETFPGRTLQVACVYGDLTERMGCRAAAAGGTLDVVDVLPIQLRNLRDKLPAGAPVQLMAMDSAHLQSPDHAYDRVLVFFLLHEQPEHVRRRTLEQAFRVTRPGGKVVIVDYARPRWWNPLRYLWRPVLALLEPFALDLWHEDMGVWMPCVNGARVVKAQRLFGGLYQILTASTGVT